MVLMAIDVACSTWMKRLLAELLPSLPRLMLGRFKTLLDLLCISQKLLLVIFFFFYDGLNTVLHVRHLFLNFSHIVIFFFSNGVKTWFLRNATGESFRRIFMRDGSSILGSRTGSATVERRNAPRCGVVTSSYSAISSKIEADHLREVHRGGAGTGSAESRDEARNVARAMRPASSDSARW